MRNYDTQMIEAAAAAAKLGDELAREILDDIGDKPSPDKLNAGLIRLRDWQATVRHMSNPQPLPELTRSTAPRPRDRGSMFISAAVDAILVRDGLLREKDAAVDYDIFMDTSLPKLARQCLSMAGAALPPAGDYFGTVTQARLIRIERGYSTSDFDSLLENIASKALSLGWNNAPETWQYWTRQTTTRDHREFTRASLPELPSLPEIKEGGEVQIVTLGADSAERGSLGRYGYILPLSREAMTNDDTRALVVSAEAAGRAAARMVGDLAYGVLTDNAALADGNNLFSVAHGNFVASGSGAAPSVTTVDAARTAMTTQTGPSGEALNIRPRVMLTPAALESTAAVLRDAMSANAEDPFTPGYNAGRISVCSDARLDAANSTGWYMVADPGKHSTVDIVTLENGSAPIVEEGAELHLDAKLFRITHAAAAVPVDYRALYHNYGS